MEMELNELQASIQDSIRLILERGAGPERARALRERGESDHDLIDELAQAGFLGLFEDPDAGPLCAELVTEWVSEAASLVPIGWRTLVVPSVVEEVIPPIIAVMDVNVAGPVRFANEAESILILEGDEARIVDASKIRATPVQSIYGYPMASVEIMGTGTELSRGAGAKARRWWQVALASEISGTSSAVFNFMAKFLGEREQFGRPLDSFQALQHRMIELYVHIEGTKWSAREAAYLGAPAEQAATAAISGVKTAKLLIQEAHQLAGAIGLTVEFDLHLWSLRLQTLRMEAGGFAAHSAALAESRWGSVEPRN